MITLEKRSVVIGFVGGLLLMLAIWMTSANVLADDQQAISTDQSPITAGGDGGDFGTSDEFESSENNTNDGDESDAGDTSPAQRFSDLPSIAPSSLPDEALDTLSLIGEGGPYPFRQDDGVFQNREGILPDFDIGHYREYTVITPGEGDRGARRIVAGEDGELYYTSDHYNSFSEIVLEGN